MTFLINAICTLVVAACICVVAYVFDGIPCSSRAKQMGFEHTWTPLSGCMINVRGQWVPMENYKVLE